jgi:4-hydroxy-3-methylbut-2-enyl diphosphate reductase
VVVVGGKNSNNTRQLVARCRERGLRAWHIQTAADLRREWLTGIETVGLTAGTSTLDETIDEVHEALLALGEAATAGQCLAATH